MKFLDDFFIFTYSITFSACMVFSNLIIFLGIKIDEFIVTGFFKC